MRTSEFAQFHEVSLKHVTVCKQASTCSTTRFGSTPTGPRYKHDYAHGKYESFWAWSGGTSDLVAVDGSNRFDFDQALVTMASARM
ncbi:hypothetical protein E4U43_000028 [Claviceps pusilla]|uniref:Uncharacterized protein n=1 Tax=Claviceps pusilla TaxID=123648 RepID=A0A9P7NCP4_9HYPO|nr:hypothetical protein E4U43_000028 [Claviceps pusilla]